MRRDRVVCPPFLLIDAALPGVAFFVAQNDGAAARDAAQSIAFEIAKAIDHGIVVMAFGGTAPDVSVFVFELDVIAVPVAEDASLGALVFQVEETTGYLTPARKSGGFTTKL